MNHNPIIEKYDTLRNGSRDGLLRNMTHLNPTVMFTEQTQYLTYQNHLERSTNLQVFSKLLSRAPCGENDRQNRHIQNVAFYTTYM